MTGKIHLIATVWLFAASAPTVFAASEADLAAERVALQSQIVQQAQQVSTLALYSARLRNLLGNVPAAGTVKPPDERLQEVILQLELDKVGLSDALNAVKDAAKINMGVDWKALHDAGLEKDTPVTRHLRDCTVNKALKLILSPDDGSASEIWFGLENGAVTVTTQAELAKHPVKKTYDVKFLLTRTSNPGNQKDSQLELSRVLMQAVAPESWKDTGGTVGSIACAGTAMTVTQSKAVQSMVEEFLKTVVDVDLNVGNQHARQTAVEQGRRITALRTETAALTARLRAAGKKVPPEPLPLDKALEKTYPKVKFNDVSLADCIDMLRDTSGQQVFVNWQALEQAGIDRKTPITLDLVNRPLSEIVTQLLAKAAAGKAKTGFDTDDDVLTLSTQADLDQFVLTMNYEIRDLVPVGGNAQQSADKLIQSIQKTIEPDTWRDKGGTLGSAHFAAGQLVIVQSNRVHGLIKAYFEGLRHPGKRTTK